MTVSQDLELSRGRGRRLRALQLGWVRVAAGRLCQLHCLVSTEEKRKPGEVVLGCVLGKVGLNGMEEKGDETLGNGGACKIRTPLLETRVKEWDISESQRCG